MRILFYYGLGKVSVWWYILGKSDVGSLDDSRLQLSNFTSNALNK